LDMSCVLPELVEDFPTNAARVTAEGKLCTDLANGLHAMAQPLTVLRAAIGALVLREQIAPANRRYFEMSEQQMERLCELMAGVQNLLEFHRNDAECAPLELWDLIGPVLDEQKVALQKHVQIAVAAPDRPCRVFADPGRTEQALRAALAAAASVSAPGETIEVEVFADDSFAGLAVRSRNGARRPDSSARLRLSIVEAGMQSQHGLFALCEEPFCLSLGFPLQIPDRLRTELALCTSPMAQVV
jgi:signal transduction histidine kinase